MLEELDELREWLAGDFSEPNTEDVGILLSEPALRSERGMLPSVVERGGAHENVVQTVISMVVWGCYRGLVDVSFFV